VEENGRGFATSNNECLLPPAKPSFSLLQPADEAPRARPRRLPTLHETIVRRFVRFSHLKCEETAGGSRYK